MQAVASQVKAFVDHGGLQAMTPPTDEAIVFAILALEVHERPRREVSVSDIALVAAASQEALQQGWTIAASLMSDQVTLERLHAYQSECVPDGPRNWTRRDGRTRWFVESPCIPVPSRAKPNPPMKRRRGFCPRAAYRHR